MKKRKNSANLRVVRTDRPMFPNAADANYFRSKALDLCTAIVSGMGMVTAMVVLVTLA